MRVWLKAPSVSCGYLARAGGLSSREFVDGGVAEWFCGVYSRLVHRTRVSDFFFCVNRLVSGLKSRVGLP